ncbi:VOC family protein [Pseudodonghicola flavimaris]|uniref:VOC family protein n=1 Tax=Pseudodonghicola flavimaris TaxID=3050036 RepID=A0ABT7F6K1_9RHOB|nr:VOC family protein [Pseudodonghicola flavimaris]MDK3020226.1 VOC family protein [Pseudodonghicola flavimaris]
MFNHITIGSNDIDAAEQFYNAVLPVLGVGAGRRNQNAQGHMRLFYSGNDGLLLITQPINDEPATVANGGTIAFKCASPEQVQEFHDTAVRHGATSIEDAPGWRGPEGTGIYLAYVRDPDGHKLCAVYRPQ